MKPAWDRTRAAARARPSARSRSPMTGGRSTRRLQLKGNMAGMRQERRTCSRKYRAQRGDLGMSENDLSAADPLGQIADEFVEALRQGQRPSVEEFARRYPEHADALRDMLPALALMEKAKSAGGAPGEGGKVAVPTAAATVPPLRQLGDYLILREIGHGGMGVVYDAEQVSLGRHVALKVLSPQLLRDEHQRRRFEREAKAAARLHHTNIVPVFGTGEHDGTPYYVMRFIRGTSLDVVIKELA